MGKDVSKLRKSLPQSPRRFPIMVRKLAETMGLMEPELNKQEDIRRNNKHVR